jgi:hypothetical protein
VLCSLVSCTIQHRHYRTGFYVDGISKRKTPDTIVETGFVSAQPGTGNEPAATQESFVAPLPEVSSSDSLHHSTAGSPYLLPVPEDTNNVSEEDSLKCIRRINLYTGLATTTTVLLTISCFPVPIWLLWVPLTGLIIAFVILLLRAVKDYRNSRVAIPRKKGSSFPFALAMTGLGLSIITWVVLWLALNASANYVPLAFIIAVFAFATCVIGFLKSRNRIRTFQPTQKYRTAEGSTRVALALSLTLGILWAIACGIITAFVGWGFGFYW